MSKLINALENATNIAYTENNAKSYATTTNSIVDFFAQAGGMRSRSECDVIHLFNKAFSEDNLIALKLLFYFRDCRGGAGERRLFKTIIKHLAMVNPAIVLKNIKNIAEFGRWDDLFVLFDTPCEEKMLALIKEQLSSDYTSPTPSILAKWMPSENTSSYETKNLAKKFIIKLKATPRSYRKMLSVIRKKIKLIETKITNKEYSDIDYSVVPSKANLKYKKAFWRNDEEKYGEFVNRATKGEVKVKTQTLFPYEIIREIVQGSIDFFGDELHYNKENMQNFMSLDMLWKNLPDYVGDSYNNTIAVIDTSGSMTCDNCLPISSAIALGVYFAERNKGRFADSFISFASRPQLIKIKGDNIWTKTKDIFDKALIDDTNIEAVFDLILKVALDENLSQDELPSRIVIVSDMQFNSCAKQTNTDYLFKVIKGKWQGSGYTIPRLTFWNVSATKETFPMTADEAGVQFVSGHSPSIFTSILKDKFTTPLDLVHDVVNKERYDCITI